MPQIACPECRGRVDVEARVCRHCFTVLVLDGRHDAGAPGGGPHDRGRRRGGGGGVGAGETVRAWGHGPSSGSAST